MSQVMEKIKFTRMALLKWHQDTFGCRPLAIDQIWSKLEFLVNHASIDDRLRERGTFIEQLDLLLDQEEVHWRQRSKIKWLKVGDRNTGFFHHHASNRKKKNQIVGLCDDGGT